jgi:hypothetical protein
VLGAPLKGWERFRPAQEWLDRHSGTTSFDMRSKGEEELTPPASGNG